MMWPVADESDRRDRVQRRREQVRRTRDDDPTRALRRPDLNAGTRSSHLPPSPPNPTPKRAEWDTGLPDSVDADESLANMVRGGPNPPVTPPPLNTAPGNERSPVAPRGRLDRPPPDRTAVGQRASQRTSLRDAARRTEQASRSNPRDLGVVGYSNAPGTRQPSTDAAPQPRRVGWSRPSTGRFRPRRLLKWIAIIAALGCFAEFGYLFWMVRSMDHVGTEGSLSGGSANILMVGSDTRTGTDQEGLVSGQRSDTLLVLRLNGSTATMMSIPRDLWVQLDGGGENRINVAYQRSPAALIRTIKSNLNIPIDHYMEVDFVTFASLVDALGGVTLDFPYPATDVKSGFLVTQPGPQRLDGTQALAYVRSRTYTEFVGDQQVVDPTGDLGRVQRQQAFLRSLMHELLGIRTPWTLNRAVGALTDGLRVDTGFGMLDLMRMAWALKGGSPTSIELPTTPFTTAGGAAVLSLRQSEAEEALAHFR